MNKQLIVAIYVYDIIIVEIIRGGGWKLDQRITNIAKPSASLCTLWVFRFWPCWRTCWKSTKQATVAISSTEAEYIALSQVSTEAIGIELPKALCRLLDKRSQSGKTLVMFKADQSCDELKLRSCVEMIEIVSIFETMFETMLLS